MFSVPDLGRRMVSKTTRYFLSTSSKNSRRKKPRLRTSTTKDRIRRRQRPELSSSGAVVSQKNVELLTERMVTRLEWAQKSLKNLLPSSLSESASSTTTTQGSSSSRPRLQIIMDSNWWIWNIILAMTPGILIAIGCEVYVKPEMTRVHLEKGGELPPPLTWRESMTQMSSMIQEKLLLKSPNDNESNNETSSRQSASTTKEDTMKESLKSNDPIERQVQEIKEQLQELEQKIEEKKEKNSNPQQQRSGIGKRYHIEKQVSSSPSRSSNPSNGQRVNCPTNDSEEASVASISSVASSALGSLRNLLFNNDESTSDGKSPLPLKETTTTTTTPIAAAVTDRPEKTEQETQLTETVKEIDKDTDKSNDTQYLQPKRRNRWWQLW